MGDFIGDFGNGIFRKGHPLDRCFFNAQNVQMAREGQRGFTLLEMVVVLTLLAMASAFTFHFPQRATHGSVASKVLQSYLQSVVDHGLSHGTSNRKLLIGNSKQREGALCEFLLAIEGEGEFEIRADLRCDLSNFGTIAPPGDGLWDSHFPAVPLEIKNTMAGRWLAVPLENFLPTTADSLRIVFLPRNGSRPTQFSISANGKVIAEKM
ncbi:MAG: type II secretion system GspH family protein [Puniceicoccales bacterium]|nr:type II secretion system GspH family protein [Puniceicoccales bacterium]